MNSQATIARLCVKLSAALLLLTLMVGLKLLGPQLAHAQTPVGNCNDSGPGSLRQALIDEPADGQVYFTVDCPSATPLTLSTAAAGTFLTLTKNVTIDGNGHAIHRNSITVINNYLNRHRGIADDIKRCLTDV